MRCSLELNAMRTKIVFVLSSVMGAFPPVLTKRKLFAPPDHVDENMKIVVYKTTPYFIKFYEKRLALSAATMLQPKRMVSK